MALQANQHFAWFTTSDELRRIADQMDTRARTVKPGESNVVSIQYGKGCELQICIDQDRMKVGAEITIR